MLFNCHNRCSTTPEFNHSSQEHKTACIDLGIAHWTDRGDELSLVLSAAEDKTQFPAINSSVDKSKWNRYWQNGNTDSCFCATLLECSCTSSDCSWPGHCDLLYLFLSTACLCCWSLLLIIITYVILLSSAASRKFRAYQ